MKSKSLTKRGIKKHIKKQMQRKKKSLRQHGGVSGEKCGGDYSVNVSINNLKDFYDDKEQQELTLGCLIKYPEDFGRRKRRTLTVEKVNAQHPDFKYFAISYKDGSGTKKYIDIGSAREISFIPANGTIEFELRGDSDVKRLKYKFALSEKPEKGRIEANEQEQAWIDIFKSIKTKQMKILDNEEKVAISYQVLQGKSDDELKDLTTRLRADWAKRILTKSGRPDGKLKAKHIGHKDPIDVIQKQRCRQAVRKHVEDKYSQESTAMREALVYHACVNEKGKFQEKRFLEGQDLKDSKRRSRAKAAEEDETALRMAEERRASGKLAYDDEKLHKKISDDSRVEGYKRSRAEYYKELEELAPKIKVLLEKIPKKEMANLQSSDGSLNKDFLLTYMSLEEYDLLENDINRYEQLNTVVGKPLSETALRRLESSRTALTGQTQADIDADEEEWTNPTGMEELGGGTKKRKRKGKKGSKKTRKHRKRNNKWGSKKPKRNMRKRQTKGRKGRKGRKGSRRRNGRRL